MARLLLSIPAAAAIIAAQVLSVDPVAAQLPVTCAGAVQKCPEGKTMYCNRWKACKGKKRKVAKYCDVTICITDKKKE